MKGSKILFQSYIGDCPYAYSSEKLDKTNKIQSDHQHSLSSVDTVEIDYPINFFLGFVLKILVENAL